MGGEGEGEGREARTRRVRQTHDGRGMELGKEKGSDIVEQVFFFCFVLFCFFFLVECISEVTSPPGERKIFTTLIPVSYFKLNSQQIRYLTG